MITKMHTMDLKYIRFNWLFSIFHMSSGKVHWNSRKIFCEKSSAKQESVSKLMPMED